MLQLRRQKIKGEDKKKYKDDEAKKTWESKVVEGVVREIYQGYGG